MGGCGIGRGLPLNVDRIATIRDAGTSLSVNPGTRTKESSEAFDLHGTPKASRRSFPARCRTEIGLVPLPGPGSANVKCVHVLFSFVKSVIVFSVRSVAMSAFDPTADVGISARAWHSKAMVDTRVLFQIGDTAEEAGDFDHARAAFERGAALGDVACLSRLAFLFDTGRGVEVDKATAMRLYQRAWRKERDVVAGSNIAILYRERKEWQSTFRWWERVARTGDGSAQLEMAKCYMRGRGVKRDLQAALRSLSAAEGSAYISEYERDLARRLLRKLRLRQV
jgi:TPR repeat protein